MWRHCVYYVRQGWNVSLFTVKKDKKKKSKKTQSKYHWCASTERYDITSNWAWDKVYTYAHFYYARYKAGELYDAFDRNLT